MKNTLKNKTILSALTGIFVVPLLFVGAFSIAPLAHAQNDDGGDYSGGCCGDTTYYGATSASDSYPVDYSSPDTYYGATSETDSYPVSDYSSYLTGSGYSTGYLSGYGYLAGGYSTGGYSTGGYGTSNTNVNTNTNVIDNGNSCTAVNSCNTNVSNPAPVIDNVIDNPEPSEPVVYENPTPTIVYENQTPTCNTCGCLGYPVCAQPVAYNTAPYVSLSQVPYTGLDLGFWGTIAYWSFLVLWCLAAAYLIVIKRVQNRIYRAMKNFLFGSTTLTTSGTSAKSVSQESASVASLDINALAQQIAAILNPAIKTSYNAPAKEVDATDDFIISQINRPRHA